MQLSSIIIVLLSILSVGFASLSVDNSFSIDGSFEVDFLGYYNETSMVVIYEDQAHSAHITFFDGNSFSFDNEMDIENTCGIDGGNNAYYLIGDKLYISCSAVWNGIYVIEYDLTLFNVTRTLAPSSAIMTDIQVMTISPDNKYMYIASEDARYALQVSMDSFSVVNTFKIPPADGQNASPQRIIAENDYIYVSTYTGDFLCYTVATASVYSHVTGLMNLMGSFMVYNNMIYTWYGPQITIYDNSFNVVKIIPTTGDEFYPYGSITNGHISYWTYANGIMSFDFTTNTATYLPLVVKNKSVAPGYFAINPSNSSEIYVSISLTANDFGAGLIYTLNESF